MFSPSIEQPLPASDAVVSDKRSPASDRDSTLTTLPEREEKLAALVSSSGVVCFVHEQWSRSERLEEAFS